MAMLICPNCGRNVWSEALRCLHCNTPIEVIKLAQQKDSVSPEEPKEEDNKQDAEEPEKEDNKVAIGLVISALLQSKTQAAKPVEESKPWYEEHSDDVDTSDILTSSRNRILHALLFFVIASIAYYGYKLHEVSKYHQILRFEHGLAKVYYDNSPYAVILDTLEEDGKTTNWKLTFMSDNESTMVLDSANTDMNSSLVSEYIDLLTEKPRIKAYMLQSTNLNRLRYNEILWLTVAFSIDSPVAYIGTYWENTTDSTFAFTKHPEYFYNHELTVIDGEGNVHPFHISSEPVCQMYEVDNPQELARLFAGNERLYFIMRDKKDELGEFFMMHPLYGDKREKILWMAKQR